MSTLHILETLLPSLHSSDFVRIGSLCRSLRSIAQIYMSQKRRESLIEVKREIETREGIARMIYTVLPNDKKEGLYEKFYENGNIHERCTYVNDIREGLHGIFYINGNIRSSCTYTNGKREGLCEIFYIDGNIRERGAYVDGWRHGLYEVFYKSGKIHETYIYSNDSSTNTKECLYKGFHENGNMYASRTYINKINE